MNWLDKLNRRFGRFALRNLMTYVVCTMAFVFLVDFIFAAEFARVGGIWQGGLAGLLSFNRDAIMAGQVWRLISFIFIPETTSILWIAFSIYFYWMIGRSLEIAWGSFRLGFYYFCGIILTVAGGFICGGAANTYLNLSLFLAYATFFPDNEFRIMFILPIKAKWLGIADAVITGLLLILSIVNGDWISVVSICTSLGNFMIFFGPYFIGMLVGFIKRKIRKQKYDSSVTWGKTQNRKYWKNR